MAVIALDLGGTKLASALFQPDGAPVHKVILPLEKRGGDDVCQLILDAISDQMGFASSNGMVVNSLGCCVPGIVYSGSGRIWAPNISGMDDYPLLNKIREGIHNDEISVILDNDRACCIMGEVWQGMARGCRNAIFLAVGTGIGAGILTNGSILRGSSDAAGAIGWLGLDQPYQDKYNACGCFEYNASGEGLSKVALEYLRDDQEYNGILSRIDPAGINAHEIFNAYRQKDPVAVRVIKNAVVYWGMTVANLVSLFNPEKIVLGGGVFGPAVILIPDILAEARKWAQPISFQQVKLEPSALGGDAGLFGAGFMAITNPSGNKSRS
jgi:glucokinase